ncbi:ABC transporter substrate-binding protein [Rhodoferax sp. BAB1]|uniref:ABC transporter substrate-binding protein n=1 Tax=Rhodoferax sp. BAB1 TaxID=2741720 RepID=UPI00157700E9|nr:ABC transporter substrate-binding protein [Rhodoferax sp. BAB1]QKO23128.1 ABC transporter substrate-binding protein [Rhodoferax sp. BAB1]
MRPPTLTFRSRTRRGLLLAGLLLLAGTVLAQNGVTPRQILIGQSITLQGGKNEYGSAVMDGVNTYLQDVNARGGVNGRQIVLKTLDDDNKGSQAEANARALIEQDKVFVLFGSIEGGPSTAVMKITNQLQVPFFGPMAGSPTLRRPHQPLVFPVRAEHRDEFRVLLEYLRSTGGKRVAFFRADSEVGLQHLENFKRLCQELGLELVLDLPFKSDVSDEQLAAMAGRIAAANLQGVINHGSAGVYEKLIRQTRAKGSATPFMAVNSGSTQLARHLGEMAHGMLFAQVLPSPWERKTELTREYQEAFKRLKPGVDFSYGSLEGYMTAKALVAALRGAGPNPTRESFVSGIYKAGSLDLTGLRAGYQPGDHAGLKLVDLALYTRDNRFRH